MKAILLDWYGDNNLGLFGRASDSFCAIGNLIEEKTLKRVEDVLRVEILRLSIAGTELIGLFSAFNSNGVLLPKIACESETLAFKKLGINVAVLKTKFTAIGNLVLCNDKGALISRVFSRRERDEIENCLGVETEYGTLAGLPFLGSCGIATNKGCVVHRDSTEAEIELVKSVLKVEASIGTVNFGSPFVGSGVIANSNGIVAGRATTGPELANLTETLK